VIYNGVDPGELLALSKAGLALIERLNLTASDFNLLMPIRVTRAKNIELVLPVAEALKARGVHPKFIVTGPPDPHDPTSMGYFRDLLALRKQFDVEQEVCFVYESGPSSHEPFLIEMPVVAELLRVSDALFMPSHREGFGIPILEAGLVGIPIFCADTIPAAQEIAVQEVVTFSPNANPDDVAELILQTMNAGPVQRLRRRVRQTLSWRGIFQNDILPLLGQVQLEV